MGASLKRFQYFGICIGVPLFKETTVYAGRVVWRHEARQCAESWYHHPTLALKWSECGRRLRLSPTKLGCCLGNLYLDFQNKETIFCHVPILW